MQHFLLPLLSFFLSSSVLFFLLLFLLSSKKSALPSFVCSNERPPFAEAAHDRPGPSSALHKVVQLINSVQWILFSSSFLRCSSLRFAGLRRARAGLGWALARPCLRSVLALQMTNARRTARSIGGLHMKKAACHVDLLGCGRWHVVKTRGRPGYLHLCEPTGISLPLPCVSSRPATFAGSLTRHPSPPFPNLFPTPVWSMTWTRLSLPPPAWQGWPYHRTLCTVPSSDASPLDVKWGQTKGLCWESHLIPGKHGNAKTWQPRCLRPGLPVHSFPVITTIHSIPTTAPQSSRQASILAPACNCTADAVLSRQA